MVPNINNHDRRLVFADSLAQNSDISANVLKALVRQFISIAYPVNNVNFSEDFKDRICAQFSLLKAKELNAVLSGLFKSHILSQFKDDEIDLMFRDYNKGRLIENEYLLGLYNTAFALEEASLLEEVKEKGRQKFNNWHKELTKIIEDERSLSKL